MSITSEKDDLKSIIFDVESLKDKIKKTDFENLFVVADRMNCDTSSELISELFGDFLYELKDRISELEA